MLLEQQAAHVAAYREENTRRFKEAMLREHKRLMDIMDASHGVAKKVKALEDLMRVYGMTGADNAKRTRRGE